MFFEIAKPVALLLCMLSLYIVFHTAFLVPATDLHERIEDTLLLLALATGIAVASGLLFREAAYPTPPSLSSTLPMQILYWGIGIIVTLFVASWYLETYVIFFRDVRRY